MANVTAALVKELRERTAAGMMDCKKALEEANGDIELAIENMRKSGQAKAAKKAGRIAAEGVIFARTEGNVAVMIELNCETDFVSKDAGFLAMGQKIVEIAATQKIADVDALKAADFGNGESVELTITNLIAKIGENMNLRRMAALSVSNRSSRRPGVLGTVRSRAIRRCACASPKGRSDGSPTWPSAPRRSAKSSS